MAHPTERGVWIGEQDGDGWASVCVVARGGRVLFEGRVQRDTYDYEASRDLWRFLNRHDAAVRLTA